MSASTYLWIILGAVFMVPVLGSILRKIDYQQQIRGKKPMRNISETEANKLTQGQPPANSPEMESIDVIANLHHRQESISGHNTFR